MNHKHIPLFALAACLTGSAAAQQLTAEQKNNLTDPDFVLNVPLDLKKIPGELYEAVVWCEIMDQNGGAIAQTGSVSVPVQGHAVCGKSLENGTATSIREANVCPGLPGYKKPESWSSTQIWGSRSPRLLSLAKNNTNAGNAKGATGKLVDLKSLAPDTFVIGGKQPGAEWEQVQGITLRASTSGAVNPALGVGYACHVGFKADVLIDGRAQNITVFGLDSGTLKTIPLDKASFGQREGSAGSRDASAAAKDGSPPQKDVTGYLDGRIQGPFRPGAATGRER